MAWYDTEPDPYTYEKVPLSDPPRYRVFRGSEILGLIQSGTRSTDTRIAGTRLRRVGKGARAFYEVGDPYRVPYDRRRDAAAALERERDG